MVSFILAVGVCFGLIVIGYEIILDFFTERTPAWLIDAVASLSFLTHFQSMTRGEITMYNLLFFGSLIIGFLCACGIILEMKKAE